MQKLLLAVAASYIASTAILLIAVTVCHAQVVSSDNPAPSNAPLTLTLQDALTRAKANNPEYRSAVMESGLAKEDHVQSRAALLPNVNYNAAFDYTQGNGTSGAQGNWDIKRTLYCQQRRP